MAISPTIKGVIFDMGETLVHNRNMSFIEGLKAIYNVMCDPKPSFEEVEQFYQLVYSEAFSIRTTIEIRFSDFLKLLMKRFNITFKQSLLETEWIFVSAFAKIEEVENVRYALDYLKNKGYKMIVLSNSTFETATIIRQLGTLKDYFDDVISSGDYVVRKPAKSFFELGLATISLQKTEVVYIGNDYYYDIHGANNAGIKAIWLNENHLLKKEQYQTYDYLEIDNYKNINKYL